jgi:hypothetical protein
LRCVCIHREIELRDEMRIGVMRGDEERSMIGKQDEDINRDRKEKALGY